jgi:hypothetical protein
MDPETAKSWLEILRDLGWASRRRWLLTGPRALQGQAALGLGCRAVRENIEGVAGPAETDTALAAKSTATLERNTEALEQLLVRVKRLEARRP